MHAGAKDSPERCFGFELTAESGDYFTYGYPDDAEHSDQQPTPEVSPPAAAPLETQASRPAAALVPSLQPRV
jgi:hypothetical protein